MLDHTHWWERFNGRVRTRTINLGIMSIGDMEIHCVVVGCSNYIGKKPGFRFSRFPSNRFVEKREIVLTSPACKSSRIVTLITLVSFLVCFPRHISVQGKGFSFNSDMQELSEIQRDCMDL